jgi:uncharacterized protein (TIGR00730 family)
MRICLYGASSPILDESYLQAANALGKAIAQHGHSLVYGGGAQGVMGAAARGVKENGGAVVGVAPKFLNADGILYNCCSELIFTNTIRERKQIMEQRADAFIMAPGGFGTFEEFFEVLTLKQLGRHNRPIAIYNTNGYFDGLQEFIKTTVKEKFVSEPCLGIYLLTADPEELLTYFEHYDPESVDVRHLKNI